MSETWPEPERMWVGSWRRIVLLPLCLVRGHRYFMRDVASSNGWTLVPMRCTVCSLSTETIVRSDEPRATA